LQGELKFECVDGGNETSGLSISSQIGGSSNPYQRSAWKPFLAVCHGITVFFFF
jgi:hypothetical protein